MKKRAAAVLVWWVVGSTGVFNLLREQGDVHLSDCAAVVCMGFMGPLVWLPVACEKMPDPVIVHRSH